MRLYVGLYDSVMRNDRMCLCGMLAAEYATLPKPMQDGLRSFFEANELWLRGVLKDGARAGNFTFKESANDRARVLLGALEGAMLVARSYGDPGRFKSAAECLLADLSVPGLGRLRQVDGAAGIEPGQRGVQGHHLADDEQRRRLQIGLD